MRLAWSVRRSAALATFVTVPILASAAGLAEIWVTPLFGPVWDLGGIIYLQLMGVALMAAGPIGVLGGALMARGYSRDLLLRHAATIAAYVVAALVLTAAVGPTGCIIALILSRGLYATLLAQASRTRLGFYVDHALARMMLLSAVWVGVLLAVTPWSLVAGVAANLVLGGLWLWAGRDLAGAAVRAAGARLGRTPAPVGPSGA